MNEKDEVTFISWIKTQDDNPSARRLASMIGISHNHMANILRGEQKITWDFLELVSKSLEVNILEVFRIAEKITENDINEYIQKKIA